MTRDDLKRVHGLLTDMDGVWFVGNTAVPGAVEALARLRARNLPMRFVTNTTTRTAAQLADKMRRLGLEVAAHEFVTTPAATVRYLREHGISSVHLAVANAIRAEFREFTGTGPPQAVVIGDVGGAWDHDLVQDLFRAIMDGAAIVAMHKGRYWQVEDGLRIDIGAMVAGLEYATGQTATVIGKPSREMFAAALDSVGLAAGDVVMVGDDVSMDVEGAQRAGIRGVLVKTGKYRDDRVAASGVQPDLILDSIAAFP
jgi:HAD superfamily hydrolase (TIGR01458 family)